MFYCIFFVFLCYSSKALEILNISSPTKLTRLFTSASYENITELWPGHMTQYIDPQSNEKYIYFLTSYGLNQTESPVHQNSYIQSEIFDSNFNQYTGINNLPLNVTEYAPTNWTYFEKLISNGVCTSPKTNDILSCWLNLTSLTINIACRLYFIASNTFSNVISITNSTNVWNFNEVYGGLLCFDDGYFIPYFREAVLEGNETVTAIAYGTILDLKGNVKYSSIPLNVNATNWITDFPPVDNQLYTMKGSKNFDIKIINSSASDTFVLNYQLLDQVTNTTNMYAIYGYYTNINDTTFPIHIYNRSKVQQNMFVDTNNTQHILSGITIDFTPDCCYLFAYQYFGDVGECGYYDVYAIITDIYGNIKQVPYSEDILILSNVSAASFDEQFVDLPMISGTNAHYFLVSYATFTEFYSCYTKKLLVDVFYLEQNVNNQTSYDVKSAGTYDTIYTTGNYSNTDEPPNLDTVVIYNIPGTNQLYFSWLEDAYDDYWNVDYKDIYGQTFEIK
eukprot:145532_1